jgi:thiol-disulfide isomerase/thioredoxin
LSSMTFKNSNDTFIEMSDLKNKNQVFFFWSSWVESCPNYIPALDSLHNLSKQDSSFEIKCINIWEKQADNSEKTEDNGFLESIPKGLSNLKDETAISGRKLGITGLPTVAIIDKDGKLAFQLSYFKNLDNFLMQILERIEYLKNN